MNTQRVVLASIISLLTTTSLQAFPIPPASLLELCMRSDVIIVATPGNTIFLDKSDAILRDHKVTLAITSVLKGTVNGDSLDVYYCPNIFCPAPASYPNGKTVLAFLYRNKNGNYSTVALSYGTKILSKHALKIYTDRIDEFLQISKRKESPEKERKIVEWLVRCGENPATQWEGTYDLSRRRFSNSVKDKSERPTYASQLTPSQRQRLLEAMLTTRHTGNLLKFIDEDEFDDPRLVPFLMSNLQTSIDVPLHNTSQIMRIVAKKRKNQRGLEIAAVYEKLRDNDVKKKKLLRTFISVIGDFDYQLMLDKLDPPLRKDRQVVEIQGTNNRFKKRYPPSFRRRRE